MSTPDLFTDNDVARWEPPDLVWGPYKPEQFRAVYVGFSGGKDSTALCCKLAEDGVPFTAVYLDTGWERVDRETGENVVLRYAESVASRVGFPLEIVRPERNMADLIRGGRGMPRIGLAKWCTQELKARPKERFLRARHPEGQTGVVDLVGIRWDESARRAKFDYCDEEAHGRVVVRPILHWTVEDVLRMHQRAGVEVNPLYQPPVSAERVGCWPCVYARKTEIRRLAEVDPERIAEIEELERVVGDATERETKPTFFSIDHKFTPIRDVVEWSKTRRGSNDLERRPPETGCLRWGLCDLG